MTDRSNRRWPWVAAGVAVVLVAFVMVWFQPHKLFVDDRVDEAIPVVAGDASVPTSVPAQSEPGAPPTPISAASPPW